MPEVGAHPGGRILWNALRHADASGCSSILHLPIERVVIAAGAIVKEATEGLKESACLMTIVGQDLPLHPVATTPSLGMQQPIEP
jgi:hypothetical protein